MNISGIVTTLNEEHQIADCIQSLFLVCDEVIVVDSLSNDHTVEVAQQAGAKVFSHAYIGDGLQKNIALPHTKNNWVLSIDADERLSDELVKTIKQLDLANTSYYGFAMRRKNFIGQRWIKCCGWYPDYLVRLYRKDKLKFTEVKQHAFVPMKNTTKLNADLLHYSFHNIEELFYKPGRNYTTRAAKILFLKGEKAHFYSPFVHGFAAFIRTFFIQGGLFHGFDGYIVSKSTAYSKFMKYAKLLEYQRDESVRNRENWDEVW